MRHACRQNHRLHRSRALADQRNVRDFIRRNLIRRHLHLFHKFHRSGIKRRGKTGHPKLLRFLLQPRLPVPWRIRLLIQAVQRLPVPERSARNAEIRLIALYGDRIRRVGLELQCIRAGLCRRMHDLHGSVKILQVVGGHLRHNIGLLSRSYFSPVNCKLFHFVFLVSVPLQVLFPASITSNDSLQETRRLSMAPAPYREFHSLFLPAQPENSG